MRIVRPVLDAMFVTVGGSLGGALAGGAAGAAAYSLIAAFPDLSHPKSVGSAALGFGFYLISVVAMAAMGPVAGAILGLVPTLLVGTLLNLLRRIFPFQHLLTWVTAGALAGLAVWHWGLIARPSLSATSRQNMAWAVAWTVAGAAAMGIYWAAAVGWRVRLARRRDAD